MGVPGLEPSRGLQILESGYHKNSFLVAGPQGTPDTVKFKVSGPTGAPDTVKSSVPSFGGLQDWRCVRKPYYLSHILQVCSKTFLIYRIFCRCVRKPPYSSCILRECSKTSLFIVYSAGVFEHPLIYRIFCRPPGATNTAKHMLSGPIPGLRVK